MTLYYGTTGAEVGRILQEGILPSEASLNGGLADRKTNDLIILSLRHAPVFALAATLGIGTKEKAAIVTVTVQTDRLYPDPAFIAESMTPQERALMASVKSDPEEAAMRNFQMFAQPEFGMLSLQKFGTCGVANVPREGVRRIALWDWSGHASMAAEVMRCGPWLAPVPGDPRPMIDRFLRLERLQREITQGTVSPGAWSMYSDEVPSMEGAVEVIAV